MMAMNAADVAPNACAASERSAYIAYTAVQLPAAGVWKTNAQSVQDCIQRCIKSIPIVQMSSRYFFSAVKRRLTSAAIPFPWILHRSNAGSVTTVQQVIRCCQHSITHQPFSIWIGCACRVRFCTLKCLLLLLVQ